MYLLKTLRLPNEHIYFLEIIRRYKRISIFHKLEIFSCVWSPSHVALRQTDSQFFSLCLHISGLIFKRCYPVWIELLNTTFTPLVSFLTFHFKLARLIAVSSGEWLTFLMILLAIRLSS